MVPRKQSISFTIFSNLWLLIASTLSLVDAVDALFLNNVQTYFRFVKQRGCHIYSRIHLTEGSTDCSLQYPEDLVVLVLL